MLILLRIHIDWLTIIVILLSIPNSTLIQWYSIYVLINYPLQIVLDSWLLHHLIGQLMIINIKLLLFLLLLVLVFAFLLLLLLLLGIILISIAYLLVFCKLLLLLFGSGLIVFIIRWRLERLVIVVFFSIRHDYQIISVK